MGLTTLEAPLTIMNNTSMHRVLEGPALSIGTLLTTFVPACAGYYVMGVLVQLNGTTMYRRALLPLVHFFMIKFVHGLDSSRGPEQAHVNGPLTLLISVFAMRATTWAFAPTIYRRHSQRAIRTTSKGDDRQVTISPSQAMWDACDLCINFRGLGWNWSPDCQTPLEDGPLDTCSKSSFLLWTAARIIFYAGAIDTIAEIGRAFNSTTSPGILRFMGSTPLIPMTLVYCNTKLSYNVMALICIAVFGQTPAQWSPVFDAPLRSTSLGEFWGKRWHQLFRHCFVSIGSRPVVALNDYLGGSSTMRRDLYVLGAFFISGVFHDVGMRYALGRGGDSLRTIGFFVMQGVGIVIERAFVRISPFRADHANNKLVGLLGWVWVVGWVTFWGIPMTVTWIRCGYFEMRAVLPEAIGPLGILKVISRAGP